ncbi:hypothetical protein R3P38DRAFT_2759638 [Favolaschia claudopus]|uniref:Uncharacterized protein n=1 Tax=Favolaschia claudopus TaxID=2862362 RepID=A0AAW0DZG4_9AGAR
MTSKATLQRQQVRIGTPRPWAPRWRFSVSPSLCNLPPSNAHKVSDLAPPNTYTPTARVPSRYYDESLAAAAAPGRPESKFLPIPIPISIQWSPCGTSSTPQSSINIPRPIPVKPSTAGEGEGAAPRPPPRYLLGPLSPNGHPNQRKRLSDTEPTSPNKPQKRARNQQAQPGEPASSSTTVEIIDDSGEEHLPPNPTAPSKTLRKPQHDPVQGSSDANAPVDPA